jgi:hypothetical protein
MIGAPLGSSAYSAVDSCVLRVTHARRDPVVTQLTVVGRAACVTMRDRGADGQAAAFCILHCLQHESGCGCRCSMFPPPHLHL